jgi:glycosyltransferase involved in cell wall biosynthesis
MERITDGRERWRAQRRWTPRIFVDCTQSLECRVRQGIPRVVRELVRQGRPAARRLGAELVAVRWHAGRFFPVGLRGDTLPSRSSRGDCSLGERACRRLRKATPRKLRRIMGKAVEIGAAALRREIRPTAGDILLLPDSTWDRPIWEAVDRARDAGASLGVLQHDFIPLNHPELVPEETVGRFATWMNESLSRADFLLAVSQTIAEEARAELLKLGRGHVAAKRVTVCPNGADFHTCSPRSGLRPQVLAALARGRPFLVVGTVEPRKNQGLLVDAIDRVLADCPDASFLVVGAVGWRGEEIVRSMRSHAAWGRSLLHHDDFSDYELDAAYRHARAVVVPSLAEGYGLPVVEALARNTPVIASDLPVLREVGGNRCDYFDPHDPASLAERLLGLVHRPRPVAAPDPTAAMPTWRRMARRVVVAAAAEAAAARREATARRKVSDRPDREQRGVFPLRVSVACPARRAA